MSKRNRTVDPQQERKRAQKAMAARIYRPGNGSLPDEEFRERVDQAITQAVVDVTGADGIGGLGRSMQ